MPDRNIPPPNPDAVYMVPGGDPLLGWIIQRVAASAVGTNAGVSATIAAQPGLVVCCTGIQVSGDTAALVTIQSPSGTTLWRLRFAAAFSWSQSFVPGVVKSDLSAALLVNISASTANCEANIQGVSVNLSDLQTTDPTRLGRRIYG
jgi:hypothetical protein